MLAKFEIESDILDEMPLRATDSNKYVLKKNTFAIVISILVHLLVVFLLFLVAEKQQPQPIEVTNKAIKSYLYHRPIKPVMVEPPANQKISKKVITKPIFKKALNQEVEQAIIKNTRSTFVNKESNSTTTQASKASLKAQTKITTKKVVKATFSSFEQLDNLRKSINEKIINDELSQRQQFRSPSVMHGKQIAVPHSFVPLTTEQKRVNNTTKMSGNIAITKNDNGTCTIKREQFLGSPVEGSVSTFACGESKFDKNFREHMKIVRDKLK